MAKNHTRLTGRRPAGDHLGALLVAIVALVLWSGCSTRRGSTSLSLSSSQQQLAAFVETAGGVNGTSAQGVFTAESTLPERTPRPLVLASATAEARQETLATEGCGAPPSGWSASFSSTAHPLLAPDVEQLLAPFFSCTSPAAFVALQRRVNMERLVRALDDWSAVRLGALGPVLPEAVGVLNQKRASFLVTATQEYGVARAEVFALFVINTAFDKDIETVLRALSEDKRVGQTLGRMTAAREQLRQREINLADYKDRPERFLEDSGRGALEGAGELLTSTPMLQTGPMSGYVARKQQLPPPYRHALDEVESALAKKARNRSPPQAASAS